MIGTYANTATIIIGTLVGCLVKKVLNEKQTEILMQAIGLAATAIGVNSIVSNMGNSTAPVLFIVALAIGGFVGGTLNLSDRVDNLGKRFKKIGNIEGLVTAVLLFCIGTLAILGPIQSALYGDHTLLFTNATLDLITSMVLASSFGISIIFAAGILFLWQGSIYLGATALAPFLTDALMTEIGLVGGVLIMCTGLSLLKAINVKTMNFLPALLVVPIYFLIIGLF
ncbi:MAG: DUF554 domain-containing protein [Clostridia bacterium]